MYVQLIYDNLVETATSTLRSIASYIFILFFMAL